MPKLRSRSVTPATWAEPRANPPRYPASYWHPSVIYYLRFRDLVKIGITRKIGQRIRAIPNEGLLAVEFGGIDEERARHQQFTQLRRTGEWFDFSEELAMHIVEVRERFAADQGMTTEAWLEERTPKRRR